MTQEPSLEDPAERLEERAERQYSLFTLAQAVDCGVNRTTVYRRVRSGRYLIEQPGVFTFAGVPASWERRVLAACLAGGEEAVASHRTAARIWRLVEPRNDLVEILVPRNRRPRLRGVTVHRSRDLSVDHTTVRARIPVTNPLRTIVDLGAVLPPEQVEDALDRMARLLRRADLRPAIFHYVISTPGGVFLAEVDFAYPDIRLAIEVDGFHVHGTPRAMAKDFVRQNGLVPYGWHMLRFTWRQVVREPEMVARTIAAALAGLAAVA